MSIDVSRFKTCVACRRTLRIGVFFDVNSRRWTNECRCCKYQTYLQETPGSQSQASKRWRTAIQAYFKEP
ncbi:hypothetical protein GGR50DRAFT_682514 [Xylaria sp. CBS 124048]|nr:hypothetical protein GGR50DRAFT_682514 [Xylaria sp. CBS 124048]